MSVDRQPLHCRWSDVARDDSVEAEMTMPGRRTSFVRVSAWGARQGVGAEEGGGQLCRPGRGVAARGDEDVKTHRELAELNHVHAGPEDGLHLGHVALGRRRVVAAGLLLERVEGLPGGLEERRLELQSAPRVQRREARASATRARWPVEG